MTPTRFLNLPASLRLLLVASYRTSPHICHHSLTRSFATAKPLHAASGALPRVLQPSLWQTMIPKRFRRSNEASSAADTQKKTREWNPATPFIILGLLIGSQAIHMLVLRNEMAAYSRKAEAKIALLKEVIERIQKGEDVAVEKILGTGDPAQEQVWADVIKEIEASDTKWRKEKKAKPAPKANAKQQAPTSSPELSVDHDIGRRGNIPRGFY